MGVTNTNSTSIANAVAIPRVPNTPALDCGAAVRSMEIVAGASGDSNNSTYRFFRVRSGDTVHSLKYAITVGTSTATVVDIGIYDIEGGAAVDSALFAKSLDWHTASVALWTEVLPAEGGATMTLSNCNTPIWKILALTADPFKEYDVTVTATTAIATASLVMGLQIVVIR